MAEDQVTDQSAKDGEFQLVPPDGTKKDPEEEEPTIDLKALQSKYLDEATVNLLTRKTPENEIAVRPGRGQQTFRYVPISWFINQLNILFGFNWDFEILDWGIEAKKHVWLRGRLTVRTKDISITKTQFGGAEMKFLRNQPTEPVDYADDLKAAASDCLKKCASLLGLAWDVYSGSREKMTEAKPDNTQLIAFYKRGEEAGLSKEGLDEWFKGQGDINKEGKHPDEAVQAEILGAFSKLLKLKKENEEKEKVAVVT